MALMDLEGLTPEEMECLNKPFNPLGYAPIDVTIPTFFGHYWLKPKDMRPLTEYVACLDSSCVAKEGQLTAYRYCAGDKKILKERFVSVKVKNG